MWWRWWMGVVLAGVVVMTMDVMVMVVAVVV